MLWVFLKLGLTSFGGPVAHLGYFHKELVDKRGWLSDSQFAQLLAICQFLPGPASSQLGFTLGLLRAGWRGAVAAFVAFTLPSALLLIGFAAALPLLAGRGAQAAIHGLKLVACAVVADAVLGMFNKLCPDARRRTLAAAAAVVVLLLGAVWSQVLVVLGGAVAGLIWCREQPGPGSSEVPLPYGRRLGIGLLAVFAGLLVVFSWGPVNGGLGSLAGAFYQAGALVFGGGHVVLPLLEESVVTSGWVTDEQFLAGYGAAQAIPGPMFAFAAYLGALMPAPHGGWPGAIVALGFMFLPGFLLVAAALPLWQNLCRSPRAVQAIAGVNAAVVGLLLAALYDPIFTSGVTSATELAIAIIAFVMLTVWRRSPLWAVLWCVLASMATAYM
ncbi:chromate ion family chromate transporter [Marinobacter sp. X15-166B]|nr:chromate ion family chromate transporter [Marinobacter sp. X15-166B]